MTCAELKRYIYENNKIEYVLEQLDVHNIRRMSEDWYSGTNPDGDSLNAVRVKNDEGLYVVNYTRDLTSISKSADIVTLIQFYRKCDFREAILWLHQILDLNPTYNTNPIDTQKQELSEECLVFRSIRRDRGLIKDDFAPSNKENLAIDEDILKEYAPYPYVDFYYDACLTPQTIKKFGIGYSYSYHRTTLECRHWSNGALIGVRGRTSIPDYNVWGIPKYFPLKAFQTSIELYGAYENWEDIKQTRRVIVFEGEKSVLKLDALQKVYQRYTGSNLHGVALFGHSLSREQRTILCNMDVDEIIIAFDNDIDEKTVIRTCEKIGPIKAVSYIKDTFGILGEKDSPIDKSIAEFVQLVRNRTHMKW